MAVTRIKNNQVTDSSAGNTQVGINAGTKLQDFSITAGKIANNLTYGSDLTIAGNLTVQGNSTAIDTTITTIEDPVIVLASTQTGAPAVDIGFIGERGSSENIAFVWDESAQEFVTVFTNTSETNTTINITGYANARVGNMIVGGTTSLTGNVLGTANFTGNVNAGNLSTNGTLNAASLTGTNISVSGTVTAASVVGGVMTGSSISVSGTVTGASTVGGVITGSSVSVTGNVTGGNLVSATVTNPTAMTVSTGSGNLNLSPAGNIVVNNTYINGVTNPVLNQDVATKIYVDNAVTTAISYHEAVVVATTTTLATTTGGTITYAQPNGVANGVGATLTTTGSFNLIDTANVQTLGTRILVKDEGNAVTNGIYVWSNATVITRSTDADIYGPANANTLSINDYFFVTSGNVNAGSAWIVDSPAGTITFGTSNIQFAQFSQSQVYSANTSAGLVLNGTVFSAKIDNNTTAFDGGGNISVKAGANLTTPNIGAATGTSLSVTGNVTGGNITTGGQVSATANITGGNITTGGQVSATANITGGNITTAGALQGGNIVISGDDITDTNGRVNFNTAGADVDFAVNGDTVANVFYVDAGTGTASFGNSTQVTNAIVSFQSTTSIRTPVGNTAQRPATGVTGMLRFNTTTNAIEVYDNSAWASVGTPVFTVIADEQFAGDGSTLAFTLNSTQTTNSCIVSINGVVQIPTLAYAVAGTDPTCVLTFTEAPAAGDVIDVRQITTTTSVTSIANSSGNAVIATSPTAANVDVTGNLVISGSVSAAGFIGLDATKISNGTSNISVLSSGGNIAVNVAGNGIVTFTSAGIINNMGNGVGNIGNSSGLFNTIFAKATSAQYADLAEKYSADADYAPGTVVMFGGGAEVTICSNDACTRVAGVVSTNPSYRMNDGLVSAHTAMVALTGRVPTSVTGTVRKGDMMVSAGAGRARSEANPEIGTVIGKALEDFDGAEGTIEVVVGRV
jgi:hypothetical protein